MLWRAWTAHCSRTSQGLHSQSLSCLPESKGGGVSALAPPLYSQLEGWDGKVGGRDGGWYVRERWWTFGTHFDKCLGHFHFIAGSCVFLPGLVQPGLLILNLLLADTAGLQDCWMRGCSMVGARDGLLNENLTVRA